MKKHPAFLMVIMLALLIVTTYVAVVVGKIPISFDQVMTKVTTGSEQHVDAVIDLRFPRIFIALFVGAILAVQALYYRLFCKIHSQKQIFWVFHQVR